MNIINRYLIRSLLAGFMAAAGLLIPLFTTFNLINELEDVTPGGYHWTQALLVVVMTIPRSLVDLGPFIALLGGIVGLGQLSKTLELTAIRSSGVSVRNIAGVILGAGLIAALLTGAFDQWVASPLQQQALALKTSAQAKGGEGADTGNNLWARNDNQFITVRYLDSNSQPVDIEIFEYNPDLTLRSYLYAQTAVIGKQGIWTLHNVNQKKWTNGQESVSHLDQLAWKSIFTDVHLKDLTQPADSFSVSQLRHYIRYLQSTGQPDNEFRIALWKKAGTPLLIIAMVLLAVPFTFSAPRSTGAGARLALGVIVGLLTYILYQIILNLGLLLSLAPAVTALGPPLLILMLALLLVSRFDRQQ